MTKKLIVVLILALFTVGAVFANEEEIGSKNEIENKSINTDVYFPRHTITVDVLWAGISYIVTLAMLDYNTDFPYFVWTSLQYEYQINKNISAAVRLGIRYFDFGYETQITSAEGIVRFYPSGGTFNINVITGYTYYTDDTEIGFNKYHLFTHGVRLAWRIDYGRNKPGGMILEPYVGFNNVFGNRASNIYPLLRYYVIGGLNAGLCLGYRF